MILPLVPSSFPEQWPDCIAGGFASLCLQSLESEPMPWSRAASSWKGRHRQGLQPWGAFWEGRGAEGTEQLRRWKCLTPTHPTPQPFQLHQLRPEQKTGGVFFSQKASSTCEGTNSSCFAPEGQFPAALKCFVGMFLCPGHGCCSCPSARPSLALTWLSFSTWCLAS